MSQDTVGILGHGFARCDDASVMKELEMAELRGDGVALSPWIPDPDAPHCCMRVFKNADPSDVRMRVAFIEKTGRVRTKAAPPGIKVSSNVSDPGWVAIQKGDSGFERPDGTWEYDRDTRRACDEALRLLGYTLG